MKKLLFTCAAIIVTFNMFAQPCSVSLVNSKPACGAGDCSGALSIEVQGAGNINIVWSDGLGNSTNLTGLCGEAYYTVDITDENNCQASETYYVEYITPATYTVDYSDEICTGPCSGSITVTVTGDNGPYNGYWSVYGPETYTGLSITNLCSNNYYGVITDTYGCEFSVNQYIDYYMPLNVFSDVIDASCLNDGSINLTVGQGGMGMAKSITYLWSNGETTEDIDTLSPGFYTVTISTGGLCDIVEQIYVPLVNTAYPQLTLGNVQNVNCQAANNDNGFINVDPTGVAPYNFIWSNGATTDSIGGLTPGFYTVTVTDSEGSANSCANVIGYEVISGTMALSYYSYSPNCGNNDGTLEIYPNGGQPPYTYLWSYNGETGYAINWLTAGYYSVTVTDAFGCTAVSDTVLAPYNSAYSSLELKSNCCYGQNNASITAYGLSGYPPYDFYFSNGESFVETGIDSAQITDLSPGVYTVTIVDSNYDSYTCNSGFSWIRVIEQPELTIDDYTVTEGCFGTSNSSVALSVIGGTSPYQYSLDGLNWFAGLTIGNLAPDIYEFFVRDAGECPVSVGDIQIDQLPEIILSFTTTPVECGGLANGSIEVTTTNANLPIMFNWSSGSSTSVADNLSTGSYFVTITDNDGCIKTGSASVGQLLMSSISGIVNSSSGPLAVSSGTVELFQQVAEVTQLEQVGSTIIETGGAFSFSSLLAGTYAIRALPDNSTYPLYLNTWYENALGWEDATMLTIGCEDTLSNIQIDVIEMPSQTGQGSFSGYILYWEMAKGVKELGEPVIGAEVFVEQEPNDEPVANGGTNTDGYYEILNLHENETYNVYVEIPGLPLLSTYSGIPVTPISSDYINMNYYVDTTNVIGGIFIDTVLTFNQPALNGLSIQMYPNPVKDNIYIEFTAIKTGNFSWELFDAAGKLVDFSQTINYNEGYQKYSIAIAKSGLYYLNCTIDNTSFIKKLVKE